MLKNSKRSLCLVGVTLVVLLVTTFAVSYALFTTKVEKSGTLNIKAGTFSYAVSGIDLIDSQLTIQPGETKTTEVAISSLNDRSSTYEVYYRLISPASLPTGVEIGYADTVIDPVKGTEIKASEIKKVLVAVKNPSNQAITIQFGVQGGLVGKTLTLEDGSSLNTQLKISDTLNTKAFATTNLGASCTTYDDGIEIFLTGQCKNNYVWYSGKLWRIVSQNKETGAVKLVTENSITSLFYGNAANTILNNIYQNSQLDQWLTEEFLPTLHNPNDFLVVDAIWDASYASYSDHSRPIIKQLLSRKNQNPATMLNTAQFMIDEPKPTFLEKRTVGLLHLYDYEATYKNSNGLATAENGYLNTKTNWWLMTPYDNTTAYRVEPTGTATETSTSWSGSGVRPAVYLKGTIETSYGAGTMTDPYRLKSDRQGYTNGETLINTRYSGEYVTFNDALYRIVGIENGKTKIIAVDKPASLSDSIFHTTHGVTFANASIKSELEQYYQNLNAQWKDLVDPNQTWYLGTVNYNGASLTAANYKTSICATATVGISTATCTKTSSLTTANIGLLRVGEMFSSNITRKEKADFWLLTPGSSNTTKEDDIVMNITQITPYGGKPSLYLKSDVKTSSTNLGEGTYESPYQLGK